MGNPLGGLILWVNQTQSVCLEITKKINRSVGQKCLTWSELAAFLSHSFSLVGVCVSLFFFLWLVTHLLLTLILYNFRNTDCIYSYFKLNLFTLAPFLKKTTTTTVSDLLKRPYTHIMYLCISAPLAFGKNSVVIEHPLCSSHLEVYKPEWNVILDAWILVLPHLGGREGTGTPLQYSSLENPMDRGAW